MANGGVNVTIVEARHILAADSNGFSDPYVTMTLLDSKGNAIAAGGTFKTKVLKKTLIPKWNEEFVVGDRYDLRLATTLRLLLSDSDGIFGSDDALGVVDIPVSLFQGATETLDNWYQLTRTPKMKKDATGELHVIIQPIGGASASASGTTSFAAGLGTSVKDAMGAVVGGGNEPPNLLMVTLKSGKDLLGMDNNGTTSDPLVKLTCAGQKHESSKKEKTLRPQWNEKFGFFLSDLTSTLSIIVEDFDVTINDFMGRADVSIKDLQPNIEKSMTIELGDKRGKKDKKERGTLQLSLLWTYRPDARDIAAKKKDTSVFGAIKGALNVGNPDAGYDSNDEDGVEIDDSMTKRKTDEELKKEEEEREKKREEILKELSSIEIKSGDYMIQVHVIEARDLVPKDSTGTSDPVVYVEILGEKQQTAVKKQVLNCVWDDLLIFPMRNLDKAEVEMGFVKLSVMDANTLQRAELIGGAQFDLSYVYSQQNHQLANVWIGLTDNSSTINQGVQGYLRASITVVGPGDKLVPPPSPFGAGNTDIEGNIIMPSSVAQKVTFLAATIHCAEELPPMDLNLVGKGGLDAYVKASLAGGDPIRTRVRTKKGRRDELCPSFNEELMMVVREPSMADAISFGVWDWDQVGSDEVVGHVSQSLKMVKALGGKIPPFWTNIYGAPLRHNKVELGDSMKKQMNMYPDIASTYRGRILMSLRILDNEDNEFDEVNQKRNVKRLPRDLYPRECLYRMRAHFVCGSEVPKFLSPKNFGQNSKMQLVMTCRLWELKSSRAKNLNGVVEWNDMDESEPMLLPEDLSQVPDIFLYLCKGEGDNRKPICYRRFTAKELMDDYGGFNSTVQWISMKEDSSIDALKDDEFPGNVLVRLGFGTQEEAIRTPWDRADLDAVNKRVPYQLRVHVYQGRRLPPADSNGLLDPYLVVRCLGEKAKETSKKRKTRDPVWYETIYYDINLPELKYAPQVMLRVMDYDEFDSNDFVGLVALNLSDAHIRSSEQLADGKLATLPDPKWYPLMFQEPGDSEGEILASLELIRKQFPDERVPQSASIVPKTRKAFIEITVLGLRNMEPFQFLPIQLPFVEFVLGGKDHASQEMITEKSKRPSGSNPNFLQRILKEVELPENAHFAPRLNIIVKDTRLGGFQTPIIASASVEMNSKIPWSKHYRPPQSDAFAEIELETADEFDEESPLMSGDRDDLDSVDNGAGVFGALKSMGVDFDAAGNFDDASSRRSSNQEDDDDEKMKKYLKYRQLLDGDLESELKSTPFEKYALHIGQKQKKQSMLAALNIFKKKKPPSIGGDGMYKIAGHFKGLIRVIEREDEKPLLDFERLLKPLPYEVRVYVLDGVGFAPMDLGLNGRPGKSDPYLRLKLGKQKVDDRKNYIDDTTDPDFYKMYTISASLPGASILTIEAMDHDFIGGDDLIGSTTIDLEDRLFDQRWQDMGKMYETSSRLRLKPLEIRTLNIPTSKAPMGTIKLWIDILTPTQAHEYAPIDISLPPPVDMELRVIVWKARNVPSFDEAEDMNDLFFRCWMEGSDYQETDIHWRAKKGKGSFNWRMKFPIVLGHKQPNTKTPYFHIQGWDKDVFTANDAIGEAMLDLGSYFQKAYKQKTTVQFFEDDEETRKKKKKSTSDDDAAVKKIKEATGLWDDDDPPDAKWIKIESVDHKTHTRNYMGEVCVSMELVPMEKAKTQPVGQGRSAPNNSPYLPPPAGRLSFSLNPFKVFNDLLGPSICNRVLCCLCCVVFMVVIYFLAPFINVAIVTLNHLAHICGLPPVDTAHQNLFDGRQAIYQSFVHATTLTSTTPQPLKAKSPTHSNQRMYAGGGNTNVSGSERGGPGGGAKDAASGGPQGAGGRGGGDGAGAGHGGSAYSNTLAEANDLDALVFEYGTAKCKFGYAGEDFPRVYESALPSSTADSYGADLHNEIERAEAAVQAAARMEMEPEQIAQWLFDTSAARLQTRMSDHPLLFVERSFPIPEEIAALKATASSGLGAAGGDAKDGAKGDGAPVTTTTTGSVSTKKANLKAREQMVEVLMEQLGIPALFCTKSAVLTCYANARTSGLVVEMGATYTSVTSVHEGYAFAYPKSQTHVFGGHDLDAFLRMKLEHQFKSSAATALLAAPTSPGQEIARRTAASRAAACWSYAVEAKESGLCRVADGAFDEVANAQLPMINYELPDKTVIAMGTERFSVPEQYFISATSAASSPSHENATAAGTSGDSSAGIVKEFESEAARIVKRGISVPEFICDVGGMTTEAELRKELFQNIILTGGSSCFENMPMRLEREVVNSLSTYQLPLSASSGGGGSGGGTLGGNLRVKVIAAHAQERKIGAFLGGSILASLGSFHEMWMSKAEYAEHGAALIHKKCP